MPLDPSASKVNWKFSVRKDKVLNCPISLYYGLLWKGFFLKKQSIECFLLEKHSCRKSICTLKEIKEQKWSAKFCVLKRIHVLVLFKVCKSVYYVLVTKFSLLSHSKICVYHVCLAVCICADVIRQTTAEQFFKYKDACIEMQWKPIEVPALYFYRR